MKDDTEKLSPVFRLSFRLTTLILLLAVTPLAIFGYTSIGRFRNSLQQKAIDLNRQTVERATDRIQMNLSVMTDNLINTASRRCFRTGNIREQTSEMRFNVHRNTAINSIVSADTSLNILAVVCERHVNFYTDSTYKSSIFEEGSNDSHGILHGELLISDTGEREIEIAVPVMNFYQTEKTGYLIAKLSVHDLLADVIRMDIDKNIEIAVVDENGRLIAHPDYSRVLQGESWSNNPHIAHFLPGGSEEGNQGHQQAHAYTNQLGALVIGAAAVVPSTGWVVYCEEPVEIAFASATSTQNQLTLFLGAIVILAIFLSAYMASVITKPIKQLAVSAAVIGSGDLTHRSSIKSRTEVGLLADSFNRMAGSLAETTASRNDLNSQIEGRKKAEALKTIQWERIQVILKNIPDILYIVDPETYEVLFVNKVFSEMLGHNPVGKKCYKAFQGFAQPCTFCTNEIIMKAPEEPYLWEFHNDLLDRDFLITDQIIKWPDGRIVRFELAKDITEFKKQELERQKLSQYFQNIMENKNIWIDVRDSEGNVASWSKGAEIISGFTMEVLASQGNPLEITAEEQSGKLFQKEITTVKGEKRTILGLVSPIFDQEEKPAGSILVGRDITDMQRMHENVAAAKSVTDSIISSMPGLFYQLDTRGRFVRWNSLFEEVTGYLHEEFEKMTALDLFADEEKEKVGKKIHKIFTEGGSDFVEANLVTRAGVEIPHLWSGYRRDIAGKTFLIGVGLDISELKQIEKELERSNRELTQFAYVASHDLQEPLRMVASYTQLLQKRYKDKLDDDALEFIHYAVDGAERMQKLIRDLLMFSRVNTQGRDFAPVNMDNVLNRVLINLQAQIEETTAKVICDKLPTVIGDESQLIQLMQNLLNNGIKFRGDKSPIIHVSVEEDTFLWRISVSDNGIGIKAEYFDKIFVIFQRLHGRDEYPGTGIGLALCKRIVERHGGSLRVESNLGEGTTFRFTLPKIENN